MLCSKCCDQWHTWTEHKAVAQQGSCRVKQHTSPFRKVDAYYATRNTIPPHLSHKDKNTRKCAAGNVRVATPFPAKEKEKKRPWPLRGRRVAYRRLNLC